MADQPPAARFKDDIVVDTRPWIDRMAESLSKVCANSSECSYALMKGVWKRPERSSAFVSRPFWLKPSK